MPTLPGRRPALPLAERFDLLRVPVLGRFLRWRWSRVTLQSMVLLLSAVMIAHAFFGPSLAPRNLAALLTWVHFRGLIVLVLLFAGNFFCMACPFMLPRQMARRWISPRWTWPKSLRNKGPAILLFVGVLFVYEWLDLWSDPWATGLLIVGYFATAFVVDLFFRRATFCKYLCPVGQFNFLGSTISPLEVSVRDPGVCAACRTKDCIRGTRETVGEAPGDARSIAILSIPSLPSTIQPLRSIRPITIRQRGCELDLFQPRKVGNLDCTFCLDCVYACPHDNIGIHARLPAEEWTARGPRSGVGDLDRRTDWSLLTIVFVFGALLNAFAMISPVYSVQQAIARATGLTVEWPILGFVFAVALVVEPALLLGIAAWATRRATSQAETLGGIIRRFVRCLVPLGFGVWLAHYGFHFFTGALTAIPVTQHAVRAATGHALLGAPQWQWGGLPESVVYPMELGFLGLGLVGTLLVAWRIAADFAPGRTARAFAPWGIISGLLFATAWWILTQPMDMRGTFVAG